MLLKVVLLADDREGTADSVERLMGTKAEARFAFISDKAEFASDDHYDTTHRRNASIVFLRQERALMLGTGPTPN